MGLGMLPPPTPDTKPHPGQRPNTNVPYGVPGAPTNANQPNLPSQFITRFDDPIIAQYNALITAQQTGLQGSYLNNLGMAQAGYDNNAWFKQASADNDLARLGLQEGRDVGLARERNANDAGFANRAFGIDSRGNALQRDMGYRANDSEAANKGSITSFGYGQNNRDILAQFGIAQDTTQLTLDKKMADLDVDNKAIDSLANEYGIRKSDVMNALKYGMTQLGLDWTQTQQTLAANLASDDATLRQQALNFMAQIMALPQAGPTLADIYPNGVPDGTVPGPPTGTDLAARAAGVPQDSGYVPVRGYVPMGTKGMV